MKQAKQAYFFVAGAILLWASTAAVGKLLLNDLTLFQVIFYTTLFSVLGLFILVLIQRKLPQVFQYRRKEYLRIAGMGFLGGFLYSFLLFGGLAYASAQEAFIINYLWPLALVAFAVLLIKEKLTFSKVLGLGISFIGVIIVATHGNILGLTFAHPLGDFLAFLGAVVYGLFSVLGKKYDYERTTSLFLYFLVGWILVVLISPFVMDFRMLTLQQWLGLAWIGAATNALAFWCWFKALEYGEPTKITNVVFLTPFISLVYIFFLVGEPILISSIIGLICIVLGIVIQSINKKIVHSK